MSWALGSSVENAPIAVLADSAAACMTSMRDCRIWDGDASFAPLRQKWFTLQMTPTQIRSIVGSTLHTSPKRGLKLYDFIREHSLRRCLELGFAHGVGTVWIGGAVRSIGGGQVIAVDIEPARARIPSALDLVRRSDLGDIVELHFDPISYTWHLRRNLAAYAANPFDFVFVDGAHRWDTDGFAFFLAERALRTGGWILFDDLDWSFDSSPSLRSSSPVLAMTEEERSYPQVRAVWEQLVLTHPSFGNFVEEDGWGWAQKITSDIPRQLSVKQSAPPSTFRRLADGLRRISRASSRTGS